MGVTAAGLDRVQSSMRAAAADLAHLPVAEERAADAVLAVVAPPRDTGRLAASMRRFPGPGVVVGSDLPYAGPMEARYGYLSAAAAKALPDVVAAYTDSVAQVCDTVRGV